MALQANDDLLPIAARPPVPAWAHPRLTLLWLATSLVLFTLMVGLGFAMRAIQANVAPDIAGRFYPFMTLHGLGMTGTVFVAGMAVASYFLGRYVRTSATVSAVALGGTVVGVGLLVISTLYGGFAAGWYFLHPLPFSPSGGWPLWSAEIFLAALAVLGVSWVIWTLDVLRAIAASYPLSQALGWHYLAGKEEPVVPPIVMITTVALIALFAALVAAVVIVVLFLYELSQAKPVDPLLMKNLTFFFGHTLVNITMYLGVAVVYEIMPEYFGRTWPSNRIVAISWNLVLALVLLAYLHHLYMDFAQPAFLQVIGQVASYLSALPAAVVSIYGGLMVVAHAKARWTMTSSMMFLGLMGWAIGGIAAVTDSTIMVNFHFHNTLWVPGHFHTYMLLGVGLMIMGAAYRICTERAGVPEATGKLSIWLFLAGGYGLVSMFYLSGATGVPRRYALYSAEMAHGSVHALVSLGFLVFLVVGLMLYIWEVGRHWRQAYRQA